jgi:hypothetical protein
MTRDTGHDDPEIDTREEDDDEALSWGESSDRSYVEGPGGASTTALADGDLDDDLDDELPEGVMGSTLLVVHGIFAAVYILFTVAWLVAVGRATAPNIAGVSLTLWHLGQYLAVLAGPLWFVTTIALTPVKPSRRRLLWLLVGLIVLIPWPFLVGGVS